MPPQDYKCNLQKWKKTDRGGDILIKKSTAARVHRGFQEHVPSFSIENRYFKEQPNMQLVQKSRRKEGERYRDTGTRTVSASASPPFTLRVSTCLSANLILSHEIPITRHRCLPSLLSPSSPPSVPDSLSPPSSLAPNPTNSPFVMCEIPLIALGNLCMLNTGHEPVNFSLLTTVRQSTRYRVPNAGLNFYLSVTSSSPSFSTPRLIL